MKKQKSRKPLRHKALLVHLFCQHMTDGHYMNTYFFKGGFAVRVWL